MILLKDDTEAIAHIFKTMVYDYIIENYKNGEPIFLTELPGDSKDYLRQEMKKLVDMELSDK